MDILVIERIRGTWLNQNLDKETVKLCQRNDINIPVYHSKGKTPWGDWQWHLKHRLTEANLNLFLRLFPQYRDQEKELKKYCKDYHLSLLPLNILLGSQVLTKFLPEIGFIAKEDPYGCIREESAIYQENEKGKVYLGSCKPRYKTILMILSSLADRVYCPVGCSHCYRPSRFKTRKWVLIRDNGTQESLIFLPPVKHTKALVKRWNSDPKLKDVYDLILSGGEPLILPNTAIKAMLKALEKAKYLKTLRICTGTVFLGLPFRIDDELIRILKAFEKKTGVIVDFNAHLAHPANFSPEAVMAARKIREAGFDILTQVPLEEGVNFWRDNIPRTIEVLRRLARLTQFILGRRPSKLILDMQGSVPLELAIKVYSEIHDNHYESDTTRPTSFAILCRKGNINLSYHTLYAMRKKIDYKTGEVIYTIPHPDQEIGFIDYKEKLIIGVNDSV